MKYKFRIRSLIGRNTQSRRRRESATPKVDYSPLEPRLALTTFVVNTISDANLPNDGLVSLREAINAANNNAAFGDAPAGSVNGDRIWFDPAIANSTIRLTGKLTITDDVFIQGGTNNITIDGNGLTGLFENYSSERVGFSRLTFANGRGIEGGAILSVGNPAFGMGTTLVVDSSFTNNEALGDGGGAIHHSNGFLYIIDTDFSNNQATGDPGSGGAIYMASGSTYINGGSMTSNSANGGGGAMEIVNGNFFSFGLQVGGAQIGMDEGLGNLAGDTVAKPANGGGFRISGVAYVSINGGIFNENLGSRNGGAIWNGPDSRLFVRGTALLAENIAAGNLAANNGGGGIFNDGGAVYVNGATINLNQATAANSSGGGIYSAAGTLRLTNSVVSLNSAARAGGGINLDSGFAMFNDSFIRSNDAGMTLSPNPGVGGGVHLDHNAILVMNDGDIANNQSFRNGGGVWGHRDSQLFVRNDASIRDNQAVAPVFRWGRGLHRRLFPDD